MDQQCSALVKHIIKHFSCLPLSLTYVLPKSLLSDRLIKDHLAGCLTNHHSDVASTHQYLAQSFNIPAPVALPRFLLLKPKLVPRL